MCLCNPQVRTYYCHNCEPVNGLGKYQAPIRVTPTHEKPHTPSGGSWDSFYLDMATLVSSKSKDPTTKVGAVIVRTDNTVASPGYNGLPRGMVDNERVQDRDFKLKYTVHAEMNALLTCKESLVGTTIYVTHPPCSNCLVSLAQAGIAKVVLPTINAEFATRWNFKEVQEIAKELNIQVITLGEK